MNTKTAAHNLLNALSRHADILVQAYEDNQSRVLETAANSKAISELVGLRVVVREEALGGAPRLASSLKKLMDQSLISTRLKMYNTNIGDAITDITFLANEYLAARRNEDNSDASMYLNNLEANIGELCDELTGQAEDIWRQISTNFGAASLLKNKIILNKNALTKVERIIGSLEHIDLEYLHTLGSHDREIRGLLSVRLALAIETSRKNLSDAIVRLNNSMFRLTRLAERARLVNRIVGHYNQNPSFEPEDYTSRLDVPALFHIGKPLCLCGALQVNNPDMELSFSDILVGLRSEPVPQERQEVIHIAISDEVAGIKILDTGPLKQGIQQAFVACLKEDMAIDGRDALRRFSPEGVPLDIWLYAIIAEYNAMPETKRRYFDLSYRGDFHPVFNGNFLATEVTISPR
jgi:hypothetical protein